MLTLDLLRNISLQPVPYGQIFVASVLLVPDYNKPHRPTEIVIEGMENIPKSGRVFFAMNHTDRFNYFPFQYTLWRKKTGIYTATWVKGKYFNHPGIAKFMVMTNNIPTPSKGYLLITDSVQVLGQPPADDLYRLLRDTYNAAPQDRDMDTLRQQARETGHLSTLERLLQTPRNILGITFNPREETYFDALDRLFTEMMRSFIGLNEQAFGHGHKVIVFPEGTRSAVITKGRTGLAQMALRMGATIVPVGCSGSDLLYPGNFPISQGGKVVYRIGEPLTPQDALKSFQIDQEYTPFTREASLQFNEQFEGATATIMERIVELVDPHYRPSAGETTEVKGANRFL